VELRQKSTTETFSFCVFPRRSQFRRVERPMRRESVAVNSDLFGPYYFPPNFEVNSDFLLASGLDPGFSGRNGG
jgi:hypothetical protein